MSLQELIIEEMNTDCDYRSGTSCSKVIEKYEEANGETKAALDDVFISLSGWSLQTLIENYKTNNTSLSD